MLDAKLSAPAPRAGFIDRADIIDSARDGARRIVAVTAPAGYGKTSLLAQWAVFEDRPVAWVSLDRFDDDPVTLLALLASAYVRATGSDPAVIADMRVHAVATLGRAAPRLASALRASPRPFVLMVDDLHVLTSPACHDVLGVVLAGIPEGSQFVTASRAAQPHATRSRVSGDLREVGVEDLALDVEGARQIFRLAKVPVTPDLLQAVTERTEGWPVGLHLAALIARDTREPSAVIVGDDRYVADYLYRESFAVLAPDIQLFLRRTSMLERFSDELCRAVLGEETAIRLSELESSNVFLIPQDRTRSWYRFHPLYREFLQGELRREEPDVSAGLHSRAADWYESHDVPAMAIDHLLQTGDRARAGALIARLALSTYQAGEMVTLQRWLTALGDRAIQECPTLGVVSGWMAVHSGHAAEADRWAAGLETATFDGTPADGTASFPSARAMLRSAMCALGPEQMLADARFAIESEPSWSPWRDIALYLGGEASLLAGDAERAAAYFTEVSASVAGAGNADVQTLSHTYLAMVSMAGGRWEDAAEQLATALSLIEAHRLQDYPNALLTFAGLARLAAHRGDLAMAHRELTRAMRARPACTYALPTVAVRVRIHLATTYWSLGDAATARHLVREIDDILLHRPALGALLDQIASLKALVTTATNGTRGGPPLTPAELRLLPYLQTHLTLPEIAARLFVSRNTVSTEVGAIYRKLGVASRSEAVDRATAVGLLGG
ncbi:MAG TPA: LuxR C-terminal-related transcriptional regulator [Microbacterium sp.]|uniref:LuxR C-terminal-related transcriptional regulator n=1 Tax=Microbacterium sp. TaxID=51671 RepID=UPI002C29EE22|nr:LuxR C-terminal-related transcriptional regulator [Microbacterium sp.]HWI32159.1 LuxR C-terminal-related transcriptional regulator [Microbacterium sp.]